jgi:hypothetical protein
MRYLACALGFALLGGGLYVWGLALNDYCAGASDWGVASFAICGLGMLIQLWKWRKR